MEFATTDKPPVPPTPEPSDTPAPNAAIIVLPAGLDIASASSNGNVLLTDGTTYWRWINGVVTKAFDVVPPDGYYNSSYDCSQTGDWVTINSAGAAVQWIQTSYCKDNGNSILSSNVLNYSISAGAAVQSYQAPYIHYSKHWDDDDGAPIVNYYNQPLQVYMLDASNQLWMQTFKAPDGATDLGDSYPDTAFYKLDLPSGTRQALDPNISDLLVNEAGQSISTVETTLAGGGASYSSFSQGKDVTANSPVYLANSGSYLGRNSSVQNGHSIYSFTVYFQDGTSLPLPVIVNSFAGWGYQSVSCTYRFDSIDQFDQVHLLANNDANGNFYGPDMCLRRKRDSQGNLITPVQWEDVGMQQVIPPAPWATDHQVSKGQWGVQAGYATPGGDDALQAVLFVPMAMAVDMNRDGMVSLPSESSVDQTSQSKPYRFWLNDDDDEIVTATALGVVETETEQDDKNITDVSKQNWRGNAITCERDLEDFARIQVSLSGLADAVKSGQLYLGLKWKNTTGTPSIKLFRATDADGSTGYLTTPSAATRQALEVAIIDARYPNYAPDGQFASDHTLIEGTDVFVIPSLQFVNLSESNPRTNFLFEGCKVGTGQLALVILKKETDGSFTTIGEGPGVWMDLKEPKEFVQRWTCGDGDRGAVSAVTLDPSKSGTFGAPTADEEKDMVLYVHGYNMQEFEKQRWLETTYKRLWHLGYKGRVGAFTWPCAQSSVPFDQSEEKAWQAGAQLLALLNTLKSQGYHVHLLGHSQGNVVIGEALRQAGPNSAVATTYIASQAAIPAHCYDASQPDRSGATAFTPDTPNIYSRFRTANEDPYLPANWSASDPAYLVQTQLQGSVGKFVNFFNPQDYALSGNGISLLSDDGSQPGWLADQRLKPDLGWGYNSTDGFVQVTGAAEAPSVTRLTVALPAERYQIFAYCAEARSLALGASAGMGGVFSGSEVNLTSDPFNFRNQHIYHSGQFRSFYAQRWQYWQQVLSSCRIPVRNTP